MRHATLSGFKVKWDTTFVSFEEDRNLNTVTSTVFDNVTKIQYKVRSQYLFAADGARSKIMRTASDPIIGGQWARFGDQCAVDGRSFASNGITQRQFALDLTARERKPRLCMDVLPQNGQTLDRMAGNTATQTGGYRASAEKP